MSDKLHISNEMRQLDLKNRNFYDDLTDEERKKFSNYLMIRWGSAVEGSPDLQEFYLVAINQRFNKNFFAINKHPKLQWLTATSASPGVGSVKHNWIGTKKKNTGNSKIKKALMELYPTAKEDEIELLTSMTDTKQLKELLKKHGQE